MALLPAASVVVTLASTVWSASAARSLPATLMPNAVAADRAGVGVAVDRQGDGVAALDVAADRAGDRHRAAGFRGVDDVVRGDGVEREARRRRRGVNRVALGRRRRGAVAGGVGGGDAGVDGMVGIGREIAAGDVDAEAAAADRAGVGVAVDRQGDGVAALHVAADRAGDRHGAAGLRRVEDVVRGDGVDRQARRHRGIDIVEVARRRRGAVARGVRGSDAGVDGMVGIGRKVAAGDVDAEATAADRAGVGVAVDRQGDGVAALHVAADRAGDRHACRRLPPR